MSTQDNIRNSQINPSHGNPAQRPSQGSQSGFEKRSGYSEKRSGTTTGTTGREERHGGEKR